MIRKAAGGLRQLAGIEWGGCAVKFADNGRRLLLGGGGGPAVRKREVICWETESWQVSWSRNEARASPVDELAVASNNSTYFAALSSSDVTLWDWRDGSQICPVEVDGVASSIAFSPDDRVLAIGIAHRGEHFVALWDIEQRQVCEQIPIGMGVETTVTAVAFHPEKQVLAVLVSCIEEGGKLAGEVRFCDRSSGRFRPSLHVAFSPQQIAYSPDGLMLACGVERRGKGYLMLYRTSDSALVHELRAHSGRINDISFSADGAVVATAGKDKKVTVWDVPAGTKKAEFREHIDSDIGVVGVSLAPAADALAVADAGTWKDTGKVVIYPLEDLPENVSTVNHSKPGKSARTRPSESSDEVRRSPLAKALKSSPSTARHSTTASRESSWLGFADLEITGGRIWIGDPQFSWAEIHDEGETFVFVPSGTYQVEAKVIRTEKGPCVSRVRVRLREVKRPVRGEAIADAGTDSGMIGIADPAALKDSFVAAFGDDSHTVLGYLDMEVKSPLGILRPDAGTAGKLIYMTAGFGDGTGPVIELISAGRRVGLEHNMVR